MPVLWQKIAVTSAKHTEVLDITEAVAGACKDARAEGLALVYCPHTTAGVLIQEAEPGLVEDLGSWLTRAVPQSAGYRHDRVDDNAASHLRAVVAGASIIIPVRDGRLRLGTWQRILFVELDGPRRREVNVGIVT